ncbi:hypothetical protein QEN19_002531 [Hanseniaspora menglaensis]
MVDQGDSIENQKEEFSIQEAASTNQNTVKQNASKQNDPEAILLTKQEISLDIQHAIAGLTDLKNSKRSKLWSQLKHNSNFILSNSHHHLRTIKRKKNIIKEKIKNGSIISGKRIPSQLDLNGRINSKINLPQQILRNQFENKHLMNTDSNKSNVDNEQMARLKFMQQKTMFINGANKNNDRMRSKSSRLKLMTCLKLLKLANRQIKQKIEGLQNKMNEKPNLANNNSELITTIKKVFQLISKHTGNYLPESSRLKIRESLLNLPRRVEATEEESKTVDAIQNSDKTVTNTVSTDGKDSKIIILANETLEMIGKVIELLDENLNKAENWVNENEQEVFLDASSEVQ